VEPRVWDGGEMGSRRGLGSMVECTGGQPGFTLREQNGPLVRGMWVRPRRQQAYKAMGGPWWLVDSHISWQQLQTRSRTGVGGESGSHTSPW
jgi:hypothetical protein